MGRSIATTSKETHHLLLLFLLLACSGLFSATEAVRLGNRHQPRSHRGGSDHSRREGTVYQVGDEAGWTDIGVNYRQWSSSKEFHVGDSIVFEYEKNRHRVFEVNREDFKSCNTHDPISIRQRGYDSFTMIETSHRFFIGDQESCLAGQKVDIRVLDHHRTNPSSSSVSSQGHREIHHHHHPPPPPPPSPSPFLSPFPSPSPQPSSALAGSSAFSAVPSSQSPMIDDDSPNRPRDHYHSHNYISTVIITIFLVILSLAFCFAVWKIFRGWFPPSSSSSSLSSSSSSPSSPSSSSSSSSSSYE